MEGACGRKKSWSFANVSLKRTKIKYTYCLYIFLLFFCFFFFGFWCASFSDCHFSDSFFWVETSHCAHSSLWNFCFSNEQNLYDKIKHSALAIILNSIKAFPSKLQAFQSEFFKNAACSFISHSILSMQLFRPLNFHTSIYII